MRRREVITFLGGAAMWPLAVRAQQARKIPRIGVLWHAGSAEEEGDYLPVLTKAFNDLGYVDGKSAVFEHRFPAEQLDRFRSMAHDLVDSKVDVIVAVTEIGAKEVRQASHTVPIVVVLSADPVGAGLIESLARPGGNVTGLSIMAVDLSGKRLALLKEAVPGLSRVSLIVDPKDPVFKRVVSSYLAAAKTLGIELTTVEAATPTAIDDALSTMATSGSDALVVGPGSMMFNERARIGAFVSAKKLPTQVAVAEMLPFGSLLSYGPDFPDYFRRAAAYADKILKGAKPADLPVEQPSRFKLTINLKAAKSMGLVMPPSLLTSADEVIE